MPNGDPERSWYRKALEKLLNDSERADRRWEEQERQWRQLREDMQRDREMFVVTLQKFADRLDENTAVLGKIVETHQQASKLTVSALKDVAVELRRLRRSNGGNGRRHS